MRRLGLALALLAAPWLVAARAEAFSPARPFYRTLAELTAFADAVVVGTVAGRPAAPSAAPGRLTIRVARALKGAPTGPDLQALYPWWPEESHALAAERQHLFFLQRPVTGDSAYRLIEPWHTLVAPHPLVESEVVRAAETQAGLAWREVAPGVRVALAPHRGAFRSGAPVDLYLVLENGSERPLPFRLRDWPLGAHTHARLDIAREGRAVAPQPIAWLTRAEIEAHFSRPDTGRRYDGALSPGAWYAFPLPRVNSAVKGWGYKSELDFRWYPMEGPALYTVAATVHNLLLTGPIQTEPVTVRVE
jgi:hypothetical protein